MSTLTFSVKSWFAWAPGMDSPEKWRAFSANPDATMIAEDHKADVSFIPAIKRRRLSPLARAAFYAADKCLDENTQVPTVFCSLYGESQRTYDILSTIVEREDVSPMAFSLSVHNAISGQFSILQKLTTPSIAIAPGAEGYLNGFVDAIGQLHEGVEEVLLVFYEEAVPAFYQRWLETAPFPMAVAVKIALPSADNSADQLDLSYIGPDAGEPSPEIMGSPLFSLIDCLNQTSNRCQIGSWLLERS